MSRVYCFFRLSLLQFPHFLFLLLVACIPTSLIHKCSRSGNPQMHRPPYFAPMDGKAGVKQPHCIWAALELNEKLGARSEGVAPPFTRGPRALRYRGTRLSEAPGLLRESCVRVGALHLPCALYCA